MSRPVFHLLFVCAILMLAMPANAADNDALPAPAQTLEDTLNNSPQQNQPAKIDPYADLPEEYIREAHDFFNYCQRTAHYRQYYDCRCMATKYLDKRIDMGPKVGQPDILDEIQHECTDASEAAGYEYGECIKQGIVTPKNIPLEDYCTCYATTYGKLFEQLHASPSSQIFVQLQTQAYITCQDPELAERLFPIRVQ